MVLLKGPMLGALMAFGALLISDGLAFGHETSPDQRPTFTISGELTAFDTSDTIDPIDARYAVRTPSCLVEVEFKAFYLLPVAQGLYGRDVTVAGYLSELPATSDLCDGILIATDIWPYEPANVEAVSSGGR